TCGTRSARSSDDCSDAAAAAGAAQARTSAAAAARTRTPGSVQTRPRRVKGRGSGFRGRWAARPIRSRPPAPIIDLLVPVDAAAATMLQQIEELLHADAPNLDALESILTRGYAQAR